ncbi:hypothetical protein GCM10023116_31220 [Kistimonas scapharcae]|uniref:HTH luxR-type domain-containing protein n=1 Tax=Kistimonas scapharcae TaxID=1036133 RepID=A0ABP8V5N1_9GAMM
MNKTVDSSHPIFSFGQRIAEWKEKHLAGLPVLQTSYWDIEPNGQFGVIGSHPQFIADYINAGLHKHMRERLCLGTISWVNAEGWHVEHCRWLREWDLAHRPTHLEAPFNDYPLTCFDMVMYNGHRWMIANVAAWLPQRMCHQRSVQQSNMMTQGNMESRGHLKAMKKKHGEDCLFHTGDPCIPPPDKPGNVLSFIDVEPKGPNQYAEYTMEDDTELTGPQLRVLCYIAKGYSAEQIKEKLDAAGGGGSQANISRHKEKLTDKLGLKSSSQKNKLTGRDFWDKLTMMGIPNTITPMFTKTPVSFLPDTDK